MTESAFVLPRGLFPGLPLAVTALTARSSSPVPGVRQTGWGKIAQALGVRRGHRRPRLRSAPLGRLSCVFRPCLRGFYGDYRINEDDRINVAPYTIYEISVDSTHATSPQGRRRRPWRARWGPDANRAAGGRCGRVTCAPGSARPGTPREPRRRPRARAGLR